MTIQELFLFIAHKLQLCGCRADVKATGKRKVQHSCRYVLSVVWGMFNVNRNRVNVFVTDTTVCPLLDHFDHKTSICGF